MKKLIIVLVLLAMSFSLSARVLTTVDLAVINEIGISKGLPSKMAVALAYEESRYKTEATRKETIPGTYSKGTFQIYCDGKNDAWLIKAFWKNNSKTFDVYNPIDSAVIATAYLAALKKEFGTFEKALWAYNWGPGNVRKIKNRGDVPYKVRGYAHRILFNTYGRV